MNNWISIKDKLPPHQPDGFNKYIVASWNHIRKIYHVGVYDWHASKFQDCCGEEISIDDGYWEITHWQPLPNPPEEIV